MSFDRGGNEFVVIAKPRIVIHNIFQDSKTLKLLRAGQSELIVRPPPGLVRKQLPRWGFANAESGNQENKENVINLGTYLKRIPFEVQFLYALT